jgi:hypothetical protein
MRKVIVSVLLAVLALVSRGIAQNSDEQDIDRLFQSLKQTLIHRSTPESLLSPLLTASKRQEEAKRALRPYLTVQFKYNVADMDREGPNEAKLPLIMEWEAASSSGRIESSAHLIKVGDHWYFRDFDFMAFPWVLVVVMCSFSVALVGLVLYLYFRSKRLRQRVVAA